MPSRLRPQAEKLLRLLTSHTMADDIALDVIEGAFLLAGAPAEEGFIDLRAWAEHLWAVAHDGGVPLVQRLLPRLVAEVRSVPPQSMTEIILRQRLTKEKDQGTPVGGARKCAVCGRNDWGNTRASQRPYVTEDQTGWCFRSIMPDTTRQPAVGECYRVGFARVRDAFSFIERVVEYFHYVSDDDSPIDILKRIEKDARELAKALGYDGNGWTVLSAAAPDQSPPRESAPGGDAPRCTGTLVHSEYIPCPVHD